MSNELWNLHCTHTTDEESDFDTVTEWAADYIVHLETQLAALKAGQGEPVAVVSAEYEWESYMQVKTSRLTINPLKGMAESGLKEDDLLYTSAPTIPEGWREKYKKLRKHERHVTMAETFYWLDQYKTFIETMLAAAPKPEE